MRTLSLHKAGPPAHMLGNHLLTTADLELLRAVRGLHPVPPRDSEEIARQDNYRRLVRSGLLRGEHRWKPSGYSRFHVEITLEGRELLRGAQV